MWMRGQQHFMLPVLVIIHLENDNEYRNYEILFLTILRILFGSFRLLFVQIAFWKFFSKESITQNGVPILIR